jgi:hypothetical protein
MTLATVGADGRPSTRVVLIKGFDERGIVWYTNYNSRKGHELAHPFAALQFHWVELERVVRIEGRVEKTERRGVRRVLRQPPARFAHRRLGLAAEPGHLVARVLVANAAKYAAQFTAAARRGRRTGAATGWCRPLGVLAGPQEPPARPPALPAATAAPGCASAWRPDATGTREPRQSSRASKVLQPATLPCW